MSKDNYTTRYFYQEGALVTANGSRQYRGIFRAEGMAMAEQHGVTDNATHLLACDEKGSSLAALNGEVIKPRTFSAFGHDGSLNAIESLLGFNGEFNEPYARLYLLGTGHHRAYSAVLMRFLAGDRTSPFGKGGINSYSYCGGDPVNYRDPSGHHRIPQTPPRPKKVIPAPIPVRPELPVIIKKIYKSNLEWLKTPSGKKAYANAYTQFRAISPNFEKYQLRPISAGKINQLATSDRTLQQLSKNYSGTSISIDEEIKNLIRLYKEQSNYIARLAYDMAATDNRTRTERHIGKVSLIFTERRAKADMVQDIIRMAILSLRGGNT